MRYNTSIPIEAEKAKFTLNNHIQNGAVIELTKKQNKISSAQMRAMHKMFKTVSDQLNEIGHTFNHVWGDEVIPIPFTDKLLKETLWRPIQMALFNIKSTTQINTEQINQILDVITAKFAEIGIPVVWPNRIDYLIEQELKQRYGK